MRISSAWAVDVCTRGALTFYLLLSLCIRLYGCNECSSDHELSVQCARPMYQQQIVEFRRVRRRASNFLKMAHIKWEMGEWYGWTSFAAAASHLQPIRRRHNTHTRARERESSSLCLWRRKGVPANVYVIGFSVLGAAMMLVDICTNDVCQVVGNVLRSARGRKEHGKELYVYLSAK